MHPVILNFRALLGQGYESTDEAIRESDKIPKNHTPIQNAVFISPWDTYHSTRLLYKKLVIAQHRKGLSRIL